ncbi:MAG: SpoIIE family protein phosphatase [Proteocatella sp.]
MSGKKIKINLRVKIIGSSIVLALVLCITLTVVTFSNYKDALIERYTDKITGIVKTASEFIPQDKVSDYIKTEKKDSDYEDLYDKFVILQKANNLMFLYSYAPYEGSVKVLLQGTSPGDAGHYDLGEMLDDNYYSKDEIEFSNKLFNDPDTPKIHISESEFGDLVTAYEVVKDSKGEVVAIVGADLSMHEIDDVLFSFFVLISSIAISIIALFITIYFFVIRKNIINPLQTLVDSALEFVGTDRGYDQNLKSMDVNISTGDEIEELANAFNKMTQDIVSYINDITAATTAKERMETELRVARQIQENMLPKNFDLGSQKPVSLYGLMRAAKQVGGDFYDFFFTEKEKLCVVIGDVSGKGVPAAMFMAMAKAYVKELAITGLPVNEILNKTNSLLCSNNENEMFVTLYVGILDLTNGRFDFCDAGHNPAILCKSDGSISNIPSKKGFVVGGIDGYPYQANTTYLNKGDLVFTYTDGITEAHNMNSELYHETRLFKYLKTLENKDPQSICMAVLGDVDEFSKEVDQFDDMTMLAFVYEGNTYL